MSDNQYLEEGFDPNTLKVSSLRNILVKHEVEYPSNAKKSELIGILEKKVLSKASKLRKEAKKQRRVQADGRDIEVIVNSDMHTAGTSVSGRTRAKKKTKKAKANTEKKDDQEVSDKPSRPAKRKHSETEETQEEEEKEKEQASGSKEPTGKQTKSNVRSADTHKQRMTKRRIRQEQKVSSDESEYEEKRKQVTATANETPKNKRARTTANFSDDNPFQSSPDTARKPRRKTPSKSETPMSALRKSQVSDLTFKVALPKTSVSGNEEDEEGALPMLAREELLMNTPVRNELRADADDVFTTPLQSPPYQQQRNSRVGDLVARYQGQTASADHDAGSPRSPTVRIRDGLRRPSNESRGARFTMTPDALRQMAAQQQQQQEHQHRRRTMATDTEAGGLPPVAPRIPVPPVAAKGSTAAEQLHYYAKNDAPSIEEMESDAQALQRRRVATMRQHADDEAKQQPRRAHSRRSSIASIASSVSEARGIPGIPTTLTAKPASEQPSVQPSPSSSSPWATRLLAWVALGAAMFVWRAHEQFAIGFGSTRSDLAPLAPPLGSVLAQPQPVAETAPPVDRLLYYAKYARATYLAPSPLSCPEHAECVPYTAIPPSYALQQSVDSARDQWVVPVAEADAKEGMPREQRIGVVQCDAGYVLQFPPLSTRVYPMVPECIRDLSTEHRVKQLVAAMLHECSIRRGRAQCDMTLYEQARQLVAKSLASPLVQPSDAQGGEQDDEADEIERLGLSVPDLRAAMWTRKSPRLSDDEFDALFRLAMDELTDNDDIAHYVLEFDEDDNGSEVQYFVSKTPEYTPICYVRRLVLNLVLGNIAGLASLVALCVVGYVASRRFAAHRAEIRAADALVVSALARLKRQARRHYVDPALSPAPAIPSLQLRDMLLLSSSSSGEVGGSVYYDPRARTGVWERVRKVVERNANVRCRTTAVRGEPMRVWEWIGPLEDDAEDDALFTPLGSPFGSPLGSPQRPTTGTVGQEE
ncbi:hypothetical protein LPJ74_005098 [Coemansia sp. RSA 1843]|nr:hypothetical protein LPJ74_005098 [Coemansia sp. RSA 1843]